MNSNRWENTCFLLLCVRTWNFFRVFCENNCYLFCFHHITLIAIYLLFNLSSGSNFRDVLRISPTDLSYFMKMHGCIYLPSITKTVEPTSPSCIIIEPAGNVTGYMQSTISRICVSSKFFMKSLSSMAVLISSRDLEKKKTIIVKLLSLPLSLPRSLVIKEIFLRESESTLRKRSC